MRAAKVGSTLSHYYRRRKTDCIIMCHPMVCMCIHMIGADRWQAPTVGKDSNGRLTYKEAKH
eukprot:scaffold237782_cov22-Prasinocladus_malaysianus.AAC.1